MRNWAISLILVTFVVTSVTSLIPRPEYNEGLRRQIQQQLNEKFLVKSPIGQTYQQDPNTFIDQVLVMIDEIIQAKHLDPVEVIKTELFGVYLEVWVGGYSSLYRVGEASIIQSSDTISITCEVGITNLAANMSFDFSFLGVAIDAGATGNVETVSIKLALRFIQDPTTKVVTGYVDDLQVYEIGVVTVNVFGLGPLDYLVNVIADVIANLIKYFVPFFVDGILKRILQQVIDIILGSL